MHQGEPEIPIVGGQEALLVQSEQMLEQSEQLLKQSEQLLKQNLQKGNDQLWAQWKVLVEQRKKLVVQRDLLGPPWDVQDEQRQAQWNQLNQVNYMHERLYNMENQLAKIYFGK